MPAEEGQRSLFPLELPEHQGGMDSERTSLLRSFCLSRRPLSAPLCFLVLPGEGILPHDLSAPCFQPSKAGPPWASARKFLVLQSEW